MLLVRLAFCLATSAVSALASAAPIIVSVGGDDNLRLLNLLVDRPIVPEFIQRQVRADVLGPALLGALDGTTLVPGWYDAFTAIHHELRRDASIAAAREVLELVRGTR